MRRFKSLILVAMMASLVAIGCDNNPVANHVHEENNAMEAGAELSDAAAETSEESEEKGMLEQASDLFDQAAKSGGDNAKKAKGWLQDKFNDAYDSSSQIADDTSGWVNDTYQSLKDKGLTTADSAKQWLSDDIQSMGAWEYKVVQVGNGDDSEEMEARLNELGKLRWECFQVVNSDDTMKLMFKRSRRSYLKNVPLRDLMKLVPLMGGAGDASE